MGCSLGVLLIKQGSILDVGLLKGYYNKTKNKEIIYHILNFKIRAGGIRIPCLTKPKSYELLAALQQRGNILKVEYHITSACSETEVSGKALQSSHCI